ncbi:extracellular solute-binding protein, partial [Mycolicibacterium poriferae]|uniref:extracellular solute-binding protein n=1 Tax=Mycolicibacterium poriferae TaxID=39694 RepID=UPI00321AA3E0
KTGGAVVGGFALSVVSKGALAQGKAKVRFSGYVESEEQLATTLKVLEAYQAKNPDVEIIPEFSNFRSFTDKLATEAAGGNAPDMFSVNVDLQAEYAARGVLTPLTAYNVLRRLGRIDRTNAAALADFTGRGKS